MGMKFRGFTIFKHVLHQVQVVQNSYATVSETFKSPTAEMFFYFA